MTLSVVMFLPPVPQPNVNEGLRWLYIPPTAPCDEGELTMIRPAFIMSANSVIRAPSFPYMLTEWPIPP